MKKAALSKKSMCAGSNLFVAASRTGKGRRDQPTPKSDSNSDELGLQTKSEGGVSEYKVLRSESLVNALWVPYDRGKRQEQLVEMPVDQVMEVPKISGKDQIWQSTGEQTLARG